MCLLLNTNVGSYTGNILYSDHVWKANGHILQTSPLNSLARDIIIGRLAGIARIVLGIFHCLGHFFCAVGNCLKGDGDRAKGHLFHIIKGSAEILRGVIEAIPIVGLIFANTYSPKPWGASDNTSNMRYENFFLVLINNPSE